MEEKTLKIECVNCNKIIEKNINKKNESKKTLMGMQTLLAQKISVICNHCEQINIVEIPNQ